MSEATLEQVKHLVATLSAAERARLIAWLEVTARSAPSASVSTPPAPRPSVYGLCADLGPGPSEDDIADVRRAMWANFPREDIA